LCAGERWSRDSLAGTTLGRFQASGIAVRRPVGRRDKCEKVDQGNRAEKTGL
jgi:hypothetical protein